MRSFQSLLKKSLLNMTKPTKARINILSMKQIYSNTFHQITPYMGGMLGLKAFVAAVLGGIGNIPGAMLGGYILGVAESLTIAAGGSQVSDAVVFGILILVLLVKPAGLLGKNVQENGAFSRESVALLKSVEAVTVYSFTASPILSATEVT